MRPQTQQRQGDCLATALAAMLDIDALDLPHTGSDDWDAAWREIRAALGKRGWRLAFYAYDGPELSLCEFLEELRENDDEVDRDLLWIMAVTHESWDGEAHAIVVRGSEIEFDPGGDPSLRPPLSELRYTGAYLVSPLDPALFTFSGGDTRP